MPYVWHDIDEAPERSGASRRSGVRLELWPHRSLPSAGFAWTIALMGGLALMPLLAFLGTASLWVILAYLLAALAALWTGLRRSDRAGLAEVLELEPARLRLTRTDPGRRPPRVWEANPYWVRLSLRPEGGPVPQYLTLAGSGARIVELGAFLTPEERLALKGELERRIAALGARPGG